MKSRMLLGIVAPLLWTATYVDRVSAGPFPEFTQTPTYLFTTQLATNTPTATVTRTPTGTYRFTFGLSTNTPTQTPTFTLIITATRSPNTPILPGGNHSSGGGCEVGKRTDGSCILTNLLVVLVGWMCVFKIENRYRAKCAMKGGERGKHA